MVILKFIPLTIITIDIITKRLRVLLVDTKSMTNIRTPSGPKIKKICEILKLLKYEFGNVFRVACAGQCSLNGKVDLFQ